ncbi:MAG: long-chain fatty acid--CoA ligase [Candidatus Melainabacteria bacterium]|nr:long-chain fatty acid--CoA ligase [Candidatus Melainabacteria bacterium]
MRHNLASIFRCRVKEMGDRPAFIYKPDRKSAYTQLSWTGLGERAENLAFGLAELGLEVDGKAAIFSATSHYWVLADLAILSNGAVSVPIYPTSSLSDIEYILNNSEAQIVFVQNKRLLAKIEGLKERIPHLKVAILMEESGDPETHTVESVERLGRDRRAAHPELVYRRCESRERRDLATIIYTSGTTGTPKGVPLTHSNIMAVMEDLQGVLPVTENDIYLSYLPLSHVFERVCGEYYWLHSGGACAFAEGIEYMAKNMGEVNPSMILVVPRVLDRIYTKVKSGIEGASGRSRQLIEWSIEVGRQMVEHRATGEKPRQALRLKHWLAERVVLKKLRQRIGPNLRLIVSGGAPATREVLGFFNAIGISTLEGYGLTETAAPLSVNPSHRVKLGTVGATLPSVQARLSDDGEILVKGPTICSGYYKNEQGTAEAFEDGWFKTGDIGTIDSDNYITITDRKKDIIVNSAGKNIAPQRIEAIIKTVPLVNQSVVFGDKRKHLVALICLDEQAAMEYARENGWPCQTFEEVARSAEIYDYLKKELRMRSGSLADYEQVKRFAVLEKELSVEAGELTATLKIKRNAVARNYADLVNALYEDRAPVGVESGAAGNNRFASARS